MHLLLLILAIYEALVCSTSSFNTAKYMSDGSLYSAAGVLLNTCLCNAKNCLMYNATYSTPTNISIFTTTYDFMDTCTGPYKSSVSVQPITSSVQIYCDGSNTLFTVVQSLSITDSATPYDSFGDVGVKFGYSNIDDCQSNIYSGYNAFPFQTCGQGLLETTCKHNETIVGISYTSGTAIQYTDSSCSTIEYETETSFPDNCIPVNTQSAYVKFETTRYFGTSSSSNDDISLSKAEYGTLIAFVFIALFVGCGCTAFYYRRKSDDSPLLDKLMNANNKKDENSSVNAV